MLTTVGMDEGGAEGGVAPVPTKRRSTRKRTTGRSLPYSTANLFYKPIPGGTLKLYGTTLRCVTESPPNVFVIDNFLSDSELEHIGTLVYEQGDEASFKSSFTEAAPGTHVYSEHRTSTFMWLGKQQDQIVSRIERRAADVVRVPQSQVEPLQVVSYTKGQQFKLHHDAGSLNDDGTVDPVEPQRIATFFVYLNTLPAGQGHTEFPELGLSVTPKRGSAVLFPNTTADGEMEVKTVHCARPLTRSSLRKFGMNVWLTADSVQALAMVDRRPAKRGKAAAKRKRGGAMASASALFSNPFLHHFAPGPGDTLRCRTCNREVAAGNGCVCAGCHYGWHDKCAAAAGTPPARDNGVWYCERCVEAGPVAAASVTKASAKKRQRVSKGKSKA